MKQAKPWQMKKLSWSVFLEKYQNQTPIRYGSEWFESKSRHLRLVYNFDLEALQQD